MSLINRYECKLLAAGFRIQVNVFTASPDDVPELAQLKAAAYLQRVHRLPVGLAPITLIQTVDRGHVPDFEPDHLTPALILTGG